MRPWLVIALALPQAFLAHSQDLVTDSKADDLFNDGIVLLAHQQQGAAYDRFTEFLTEAPITDPRREDAEYFQALTAVSLHHNDGEKAVLDFTTANAMHPRAATAYYDLGTLYYNQKNYPKAIANFSKVNFPSLTAEHQNAGRFRWGYSLFSQKEMDKAADQFSFIKSQGGTFGPAASYYAGFVEYALGDYEDALKDLKRAELNDAYATVVPYMIAQVLFKQKNYDELLKYVDSIKGREDVNQAEEINLLAAEVRFKRNDFEGALKGYMPYLDKKPDADKSIYFRAGVSAMRTNNDNEAMDLFKRASGEDSIGAHSSYYVGMLYVRTGQKVLAITAFDAARKFEGDRSLSEESWFQLGKVSYDLGYSDLAIRELEKFLIEFPASSRSADVKETLSHAYVDSDNYNKAIEYIEGLPKRGPTLDKVYQRACHLKASELFNKALYGEAVTYFEKSLSAPLDPAVASESHYWCAEAYSVGHKYEEAAEHYSAIISPAASADPALVVRARYGIAYAYYNLKQYDRALYNFTEFTNRAGKDNRFLADGVLRLADCQYVHKDYPTALASYKRVLQMGSPDKDYAHLQAGIIYQIQRKYNEASAELQEVVKAKPVSAYREEALFQLAQLEFEQGKYSSAVSGYTRVLETGKTSPLVPYAHMRRAAAYFNLKEYGKTADDYIVVVQNYPLHPAANDVLVPLQEALGLASRGGEFDALLASFKKANPDARGIESVEFETAKNLYFNQEYAKAIARLESFASAYPTSAKVTEARFYQAESYYRLKDFPKALAIYNQLSGDDAFPMIVKVAGRVAELQFKSGDFSAALPSYRRLAGMATNKKDQYAAWAGLMEAHHLLAQYDSSDRYAHLIIEKGNINPGAGNKASLFLGKNAKARGDYETAKDEFLNTLNTARDEFGAEAKYLLAEIFYLNREHKQAYETLVSLNTDFQAYTEWVGKSFLLMADNSIAMGDSFQAKYTLQSLIDNFPLQEVRDRAAEKLRRLDQQEKAKATPPDTTIRR
jgi:tetratricopeptide (TPR) repeat protein